MGLAMQYLASRENMLGLMRGRVVGLCANLRRVGNNSRCSSQSCIVGAASSQLQIRSIAVNIKHNSLNYRKRS
jgi:hypothetical protein